MSLIAKKGQIQHSVGVTGPACGYLEASRSRSVVNVVNYTLA